MGQARASLMFLPLEKVKLYHIEPKMPFAYHTAPTRKPATTPRATCSSIG